LLLRDKQSVLVSHGKTTKTKVFHRQNADSTGDFRGKLPKSPATHNLPSATGNDASARIVCTIHDGELPKTTPNL